MGTFTTIACLLAIAAILNFLNDRYLHLQPDIGLLLLAGLTTVGLRVLEVFVPFGLVGLLHQVTQSFNLNDTLLKGVLCFILFRGSVRVRWVTLREQLWLVLWLAFAGTALACVLTGGLAYGGLSLFGVAIAAIARMSHPGFETSALLAACYAQQGRDTEARREMSAYRKVAPAQIANYPGEDGDAWRKYWARRFPFKRASDVEHLLDGFRKAGLPV